MKWLAKLVIRCISSSKFWSSLLILTLFGFIVYQQVQINELRDRLDASYDMSNSESFDYRITNLEHISNAHAKRLKEAESTIWDTSVLVNHHDWRLRQLEWQHPNVKVLPLTVEQQKPINFNPNPNQVPSPLTKGEPVWVMDKQ